MISNVVDINGQNKTWKLLRIEAVGFDPSNCSVAIPNIQFYYRYSSSADWMDIYNQNWIEISTFPYVPPSTQMVKFIQYMVIMNSLNDNEQTPVLDEVRFIFDSTITPFSVGENYFYQNDNKIEFLKEGHLNIIRLDGSIYKTMKVSKNDKLSLEDGIYIFEFIDKGGRREIRKVIVK
jgi:hypothetical protein